MSRIVSTLINAVLSPFAKNSPTVPVQSPAALTLLAFARREFEPAFFSPSTTVNRLAGQITNGLVTDTVGSTSAATSAMVDPGFISSTRIISACSRSPQLPTLMTISMLRWFSPLRSSRMF